MKVYFYQDGYCLPTSREWLSRVLPIMRTEHASTQRKWGSWWKTFSPTMIGVGLKQKRRTDNLWFSQFFRRRLPNFLYSVFRIRTNTLKGPSPRNLLCLLFIAHKISSLANDNAIGCFDFQMRHPRTIFHHATLMDEIGIACQENVQNPHGLLQPYYETTGHTSRIW